eukprot:1882355-Amphidinium_carterae.1
MRFISATIEGAVNPTAGTQADTFCGFLAALHLMAAAGKQQHVHVQDFQVWFSYCCQKDLHALSQSNVRRLLDDRTISTRLRLSTYFVATANLHCAPMQPTEELRLK